MPWCLIKSEADKFLKKIKDGEIDPEKLAKMTSSQRRDFFTTFLDENNAKQVNALFESKILLKNQKQGYLTWAKTIGGMKTPAGRDFISRVNRMEKYLNPAEEEVFLADAVAKKLGGEVTREQSKKIFDLSEDVIQKREMFAKDITNKDVQLEYGRAIMDFKDYINEISPTKTSIYTHILSVLNLGRSSVTGFDLSAAGRQGRAFMGEKEFVSAFVNMHKYAVSKSSFRDLQAMLVADPYYDKLESSGLRISALAKKLSDKEEGFMTNLASKIPILAASERAYVGFLTELRFNVAKKLVQIAEAGGVELPRGSKELKEIVNYVNNYTLSGNIGKDDQYANIVPLLNAVFFSPRGMSGRANMLDFTKLAKKDVPYVVKKGIIKSWLVMGAFAGVIGGLGVLAGKKTGTDLRSSDFATLTSGKTHYDLSSGIKSYINLIARIATNETVSKGKVKELGSKTFPFDNRGTLVLKFFRNKLAPIASSIVDLAFGENFLGKKTSVKNEVKENVVPIVAETVYDLVTEDPNNLIIGFLWEFYGQGVNVY